MMAKLSGSEELSLSDMLRAAILAQPDRTAVSCGTQRLTFQQLGDRSEHLAGRLRRLGAAADVAVGIFMEPSVDLMASVWGVLHAGAAYLPLSPEYPDERVRYMIADSGTGIVLTHASLVPRLRALTPPGTRIVTPDGGEEGAGAFDRSVPAPPAQAPAPAQSPVPARPDALAYLIYTSGSTGSPKGIGIEQHSIVRQLRWLAEEQGLDHRRTVLQKTPLSFDAAQWEILAPACGSAVVMSEPGGYADPEGLIGLVQAHGVTTLQGVPTLLQALVDTGRLSGCTSLTHVFSGGEALTRTLAIELLDALPDCALVNLYGPSECTINASAHTVDRNTVRDGPDHLPIGRPVPGLAFHVLDPAGRPLAPGEAGELHISGAQLARGYWNNPELTGRRFPPNPFADPADPHSARLYRTGDLARWNDDGTVQFLGRTDSQVKLRGFRVELDEVKVSIERHDWVKRAAVLVREDTRVGANLVAFVELDPRRAALMDQGNHGAHHQSKRSRLQLKAQLADLGVRREEGPPAVGLPGRDATAEQRRTVFGRKTYRFYDGGGVDRADLLALLAPRTADPTDPAREPGDLDLAELGFLLRYFGQFHSTERLLPKYGYASPGSLYATQLYLELSGIAGLDAGFHYYHPVLHRLERIAPAPAGPPRLRAHLVGRRSAIEPVYRNNIEEVLRFEAGHLVGLFDHVLPRFGLRIGALAAVPGVKELLRCPDEDYYLGSYEVASAAAAPDAGSAVEVYVQAHPGRVAGLPGGQYRYRDGDLVPVSEELVRRRDVIAINQEVYERAAFGVGLVGRAAEPWQRYADLGRELQRLQLNGLHLGLMSAGYSSETGNPLPAALRLAEITGHGPDAASYFAVGGRISAEQWRSEGMREDSVHLRGPAEIVRDNLAETLPPYMVPNRVTVLDAFPLTPNGKVDQRALRELDRAAVDDAETPVVAPRTPTEEAIAALWAQVLRQERVSIRDDFFAAGGHSLTAVSLVGRINRELGAALPLQVLFDAPTIAELARRVDREPTTALSRLVRLRAGDGGRPVFCWPGLGGYPMSLRLLAGRLDEPGRPFVGVQAYGVNAGEVPYPAFEEMVAADLALIRRLQPSGPYTLWGYSFGARLAFAAAHRLERAGERVDEVVLLAPGKPPVEADGRATADFGDPAFVSILYSVFAGNLEPSAVAACLAAARDEESFTAFVLSRFAHLDPDLVRRITGVVRRTFRFEYDPGDLSERGLRAPVTVLRARGDQDSFLDAGHALTVDPPTVHRLDADHYQLLRAHGMDELVGALRSRRPTGKVIGVPHVSIKHFPDNLAADQISTLVDAITSAVRTAFSVDAGAVSIALEPVARDVWNERVYIPEIVEGTGNLVKAPTY
ncbi:amino acid adenylation domain-containing protein [Streptomyces sp. LP11]|uniref:Amino acid adenylation domain-containing protein n=1 Tax=Streptomyces pyxinicus TaxID=2970331 RepID=A0ABT2BBG0_9ACTN|nr:amino acid adenylation domain-containing protein [Streptomyces sp. LP11]MCS0605859.1 amino acid adenylation domain-containing protein [Streptomyces sp. LP11]